MSDDRSRLRAKLRGEVMPVTWALLEPHAQRDALFLVDGVEIDEAAVAVACDERSLVAQWVERGALRRPTKTEVKEWAAAPVAFKAVIVQPFVLAEPIR